MLPKVSVFLLTYQQAHFIDETIESVLIQNYPNLEIVVGDDGSTDGTQAILKEYDSKYPGLFKLILSSENEGITANSNKVLEQCSGDYIALLGGDDLWLPGKLHKQIEWFLKNPDASICHTKTEKFESTTGEIISYIPGRATCRNSPAGLGEFLEKPPRFVCSSFMVQYWAIPSAGFDGRVKLVSDWLFLLAVLEKGRMGYIDDVLTRYRRHSDNVSSSIDLMFFDVMLASNIAETKYPKYLKYIKRFRFNWILRYANAKCLNEESFYEIVKKGITVFYNVIEYRIKSLIQFKLFF